MININLYAAANMASAQTWYGAVTGLTPTSITITNGIYTGIYTGNFSYNNNSVQGILTGYNEYYGANLQLNINGFSLNATTVYNSVQSNQLQSLGTLMSGQSVTINGSTGTDVLIGYGKTNLFYGNGGNDTLQGGPGLNTAFFSATLAQHKVSSSGGIITVSDTVANRDGADTLVNIQQIHFTDTTLVFDLTSSQDALVYRLYQAAYARTPDNGGFRYWADVADRTGMSAISLADQFLAAPEFAQKYGNPDNLGYATKMYGNVLGRTPDASGLAYWAGQLDKGMPRDQLLVAFAVCDENVQLTGVHMSNGYWTV